jgi:hypothetical protein
MKNNFKRQYALRQNRKDAGFGLNKLFIIQAVPSKKTLVVNIWKEQVSSGSLPDKRTATNVPCL